MSINEIEAKARELRQLQALIEEAQAEAEAIKDALKAAMGDSESIQAGEYKIPGRSSRPPESTPRPLKRPCRMWRSGSRRKPPRGGSAWHDGADNIHRRSDLSHWSAVPAGGLHRAAQKKGPLCSRRPKQSTRDHLARPQGGRVLTLYHGPCKMYRES